MSYPDHPSRAFTLVELMAVIAIIGLLVALLLPALEQARTTAQTVTCLSHERQMFILSMSYVTDNHGWAPYPNWAWHPCIGKYGNGPLGGNSAVFWCPAAGTIPLASYSSWNCAYTASYPNTTGLRVSTAKTLATRTWLKDAFPVVTWGYRAGDWNVAADTRHNNGYNYLTWGGNAQGTR